MKPTKKTTQLPLYDPRRSPDVMKNTIVDYAKNTPMTVGRVNPDPNLIQNLRRPGRGGA